MICLLQTGEIDIIEGGMHTIPTASFDSALKGVHDNQHNQVTWHTGPGLLSPYSYVRVR